MRKTSFSDEGTLLSTLSINESFATAQDDPMDVEMDSVTPESEEMMDQSTPFDWKVWARKDFATPQEVEKAEIKRDLKRALETIDGPSEYDTAENTIQDESQDQDHNDNANTTCDSASTFSILSPTNLGAKFALSSNQKLLMPPPVANTMSKNEEDDDSYDESVRNMSTFSSSSDRSLIFMPQQRDKLPTRDKDMDMSFNTSDFNHENSYLFRKRNAYAPNTNASMFLPKESYHHMQPVQVHHHHYYGSPQNARDILYSPGQNQHLYQQDITSSSIAKEEEKQQQRVNRDINGELPAPWSPNSTPHERVPYIISSYIQLSLNLVASSYAIYLIFCIVNAIRTDIAHKVQQHAAGIVVQIASCKRSYYENHCDTNLVPATQQYCDYWLKCMSQNPNEGGNMSSISAETVGVIINSLVEPLGFKFLCIMFGFISILFASNFMFGFFRAKAYYGWEAGLEQGNNISTINYNEKRTLALNENSSK